MKIYLLGLGFATQLMAAQTPSHVNFRIVNEGGQCSRSVAIEDPSNPTRIHLERTNLSVNGKQRRFCQVTIKVDHPPGWQYAIYQYDSWIKSRLPAGSKAEVKGIAYFQGGHDVAFGKQWSGPHNSHFDIHHRLDDSTLKWSDCTRQRDLNLKSTARVSGRSGGSLTIKHMVWYGLKWRRC